MNQRGQSLLEMVITIGVAVVIIVALTITTVKGLQSGQFAQNQVQAAKLAQEGLERMRSFRENDVPVRLGGVDYSWSASASQTIWGVNFDPGACAGFGGSNCYFQFLNCPGPSCYAQGIIASTEGEVIPGTIFRRKIMIEDYSVDNKKITSIVTWSDTSGKHESKVVTVLSNY